MSGWVCPKCGRVYAPNVTACGPCNLLIDNFGPHPVQTVVRPQMTRHQEAFEIACEKEAKKP